MENGKTGWSRNATATHQITTLYNCAEQKSISQCTTLRTLRWIRYTATIYTDLRLYLDLAVSNFPINLNTTVLHKDRKRSAFFIPTIRKSTSDYLCHSNLSDFDQRATYYPHSISRKDVHTKRAALYRFGSLSTRKIFLKHFCMSGRWIGNDLFFSDLNNDFNHVTYFSLVQCTSSLFLFQPYGFVRIMGLTAHTHFCLNQTVR